MLLADEYLQKLIKAIKHSLLIAKQRNAKCEVFANINWGISTNIRMQNIDTLEFNNSTSLSITVYKDQHKGNVNITTLDNYSLEQAIDKALKIAEFTAADPYSGLADPDLISKEFLDLELYHHYDIKSEDAINLAKKCEQAALNYHKDIVNSDGVIFNYANSFTAIGNSHDFIAAYPKTSYSLSCTVIAENTAGMQRDSDFTVARNFMDLIDPEIIGHNAGAYTYNRLGATKISTCQTKVLFTPQIAANLFSYLIAAISGHNIANKSSFLLDRLKHKIFPEFIQIVDHPFIAKGLKSCCFDEDGISAKKQAIVSNGVLNTYLLSNYYAKKLGLNPTGNANGIYNLFINNQDIDFNILKSTLPKPTAITYSEVWQQRADLIKQMGTGLIVTETIGEGVNLVTGNYSKGAFGFWVENGKISYPIHEITIAGNLMDMFANIIATGKDYDYQNNIITGSILIDNMIVGGN